MQSITQTQPQSKRLAHLLEGAAQRGYNRRHVEECLEGRIGFEDRWLDNRGNMHYGISVWRSDLERNCQIQLTVGPDGNSAGCVTCAYERAKGKYVSRLVSDCPAVAAVCIEYALTHTKPAPEPEPVVEEPKPEPTLLDLALAEFNRRNQWSSSDTVTVWEAGNRAAWLSRNSQGFIYPPTVQKRSEAKSASLQPASDYRLLVSR